MSSPRPPDWRPPAVWPPVGALPSPLLLPPLLYTVYNAAYSSECAVQRCAPGAGLWSAAQSVVGRREGRISGGRHDVIAVRPAWLLQRETRTRHDTVSLRPSSSHWPIANCRQSVSYNFSSSLALHLRKLGTLSRCEKSNHRNEGLEGNVKVLSLKTLHIIFINSSAL